MKAFTKIINLLVIIAMLSVVFPLVRPEDANRDSRIDLEDTILNIRLLARSAETSGSFAAGLENAVASLKIAAGLKTVIKEGSRDNRAGVPTVINSPYLISTYSLYLPSYVVLAIIEDPLIFKSLAIAPSLPPPRSGLFC